MKHYPLAAASHSRFKQAFKAALRSMLDDATLARVESALNAGDSHAAADVLTDNKAWETFQQKLEAAYEKVVDQSGAAVFAKLPARVEKAKKATVKPPPVFGEKWVKERSAKLVQDITSTQRVVLREVILENFKAGKRASFIVDDIRSVVGLLPKELDAVENRKQLHIDAGMSEAKAEKLSDTYADELLDMRADRIAVTETVAAEAQGRREAWEYAQETGLISPTARRVWVASDDACEECAALDGEEADIDGTYEGGAEIPMHPWCYCTEMLDE